MVARRDKLISLVKCCHMQPTDQEEFLCVTKITPFCSFRVRISLCKDFPRDFKIFVLLFELPDVFAKLSFSFPFFVSEGHLVVCIPCFEVFYKVINMNKMNIVINQMNAITNYINQTNALDTFFLVICHCFKHCLLKGNMHLRTECCTSKHAFNLR